MSQLEKHGKGIHRRDDRDRKTAEALTELDPTAQGGRRQGRAHGARLSQSMLPNIRRHGHLIRASCRRTIRRQKTCVRTVGDCTATTSSSIRGTGSGRTRLDDV